MECVVPGTRLTSRNAYGLVVVMVVFKEYRFLFPIDRDDQFGLNALWVIAAGTHESKKFLVLCFED